MALNHRLTLRGLVMNEATILNIAEKYLQENDIKFIVPGKLGRLDEYCYVCH